MNAELETLHQKVLQLAALCRQLRSENAELRQQLVQSSQHNRLLQARLEETCAKIADLISQLPEEDDV